MRVMLEQQRQALGGYAAFMDACTLARLELATQVDNIGVPMRSVAAVGVLVSEISGINTSVAVPPTAFALPQGYTLMQAARNQAPTRNARNEEEAMYQRRAARIPPGYAPPRVLQGYGQSPLYR